MAVENCNFASEKLGKLYSTDTGLRIFTCTWNMHGKGAPGEEEMRKLFSPNLCHLYAVGTQECEKTQHSQYIKLVN